MTQWTVALLVAFLAGVGAGVALASAPSDAVPRPSAPKVAVVVAAGDAPGSAARVAAARAGARAAGVTWRAPRTPAEQLSVTARLAAGRYGTIVGVGLDARRAIAPLRGRVRYVPVPAGAGLDRRVEAAAAR